ncbi:SpoVR family protein [bacterium]|nr:SpoVR family protein [bacterium]
MEIIDQRTKAIMEACKVRARDAGLQFDNESLEYIVTNRDLIELSPKGMIPTLYDYWVNDVEVIKGTERYRLYPTNPYETVINSRPAISFYNDNNPDWLNIMIFYHVLGHIDFFQNNMLFSNTWNDDFVGQALADKRLITSLRSEHGRWVDYIIEFCRGLDNIVGYFDALVDQNEVELKRPPSKIDYYFDIFLQEEAKLSHSRIYQEVDRYNELYEENPDLAEAAFFTDVRKKYPEFITKYDKYQSQGLSRLKPIDLIEYIRDNSKFLAAEDNGWIKSILNIVRNTALYFGPQIRSKILNEGWASYWHDELFCKDDRIKGHEIAYAKTNAMVTSIDRVGLNPYAIGLRLVRHVEELADKGKLRYDFQKMHNIRAREDYDLHTHSGKEAIFELRGKFSDFMMINTFIDQDFIDHHGLFVVGKRVNQQRQTYEYYVKSRRAEDYKQMLLEWLYHPPFITVDESKTSETNLFLTHKFEGKELFKSYISHTLLGIEYLWGGQVQLETTELIPRKQNADDVAPEYDYQRVLYTMKDRKLAKVNL